MASRPLQCTTKRACTWQALHRTAAVPLPATRPTSNHILHCHASANALRRKPLQPLTRDRRRAAVRPQAIYFGGYPSSSGRNYDRVAAAPPQARQALLSSAISSCRDWRQLEGLVEQYGQYLSANNISHCLTRLEQMLAGQYLNAAETGQVEDLLEWLLRRGRELNATAQLGPQALGATAGALARLQEAQLRQQQQEQLASQRQQQQQLLGKQRAQQQEDEARRAAAAADRKQLMQQLVDAAVAQRRRLSPQALNDVLSGLASIDESGMSANEIRRLLNIPTPARSNSGSNTAPAGMSARELQQHEQQQQAAQLLRQQGQQRQQQEERERQELYRQRQMQQRRQPQVSSPGELRSTARQLGQLSPELAQEWHDRALRNSLEQGAAPPGIDRHYLTGFLAREIERAANRARESSTSSTGRGPPLSGAALLQAVMSRYAQLLTAAHLALIGHKLAELKAEHLAGTQQEVEVTASMLFQLCQARIATADAATITSIISSCKELGLYSRSMVSAALQIAKTTLEQQIQGALGVDTGFTAKQLGVLLHSLAVLDLRPSDALLRPAIAASGQLMPGSSLTDVERIASSLLVMRTAPGRAWLEAAEARLYELAAAIGRSKGTAQRAQVLRGAVGEDAEVEETEADADLAADIARKALVACVKALALLGSQKAAGWHSNILTREQQQREQEAAERRAKRQQEASAEKQAQSQLEGEQQQPQQWQQQKDAASTTGETQLEQQLRKAVQQQQHKRVKPHIHSHHHVQHRHQQKRDEGTSELPALSSLDELMSQALEQQEQQQAASGSSRLPSSATSIQEAGHEPASSSSRGVSSQQSDVSATDADQLQAAAPASWAAEQSARWADAEGKAASPAAELQQQLDDSRELFGSRGSASTPWQQAPQQQQQRPGFGAPGKAEDIEVEFADGTTGDNRSSGRTVQQERSADDAASALAALMAEVEAQDVDEAAHREVQRELDAAAAEAVEDAAAANAEGAMSLQDIQAAADAVQQATQQLEELERQQKQHDEQEARKHHKHRKQKHHTTGAAGAATSKADVAAATEQRRPLGSSGEAAFVAAAKNLASGKPSRNYLLGCLEAIEMQQNELKRQLAERQAMAAVANAAQRQRAAAALDSDPLARKVAQLQADFDRARQRAADEKAGIKAAAVVDVTQTLMPLLDSLDAALEATERLKQKGQQSADVAMHTIYESLNNQLLTILKSHGVAVIGYDIDIVATPFDPNCMEAVMRQPASGGFIDGDVLQVLRYGYAVGDRLVRPALVVVAYED